MSHRERQTCAPESVTPQENGLWHPVGSGTPVPGTGTAAGKVISACLLSRQTILCVRGCPSHLLPTSPEGLPADVPGALLSAWRWFQQVLAAGNQKDSNRACGDPGERGVKAGWFHGQKERLRACRRQDKSRERPTGWQAGPPNRAPTPKHSLSAPSFAGERWSKLKHSKFRSKCSSLPLPAFGTKKGEAAEHQADLPVFSSAFASVYLMLFILTFWIPGFLLRNWGRQTYLIFHIGHSDNFLLNISCCCTDKEHKTKLGMNAIQKSICLKIKHLGESGRKQVAMWLEKKNNSR